MAPKRKPDQAAPKPASPTGKPASTKTQTDPIPFSRTVDSRTPVSTAHISRWCYLRSLPLRIPSALRFGAKSRQAATASQARPHNDGDSCREVVRVRDEGDDRQRGREALNCSPLPREPCRYVVG